jgi:glycosyltransferase involved in cell wall biosynthesis
MISVVLPTYNRAESLRRAMDSVLGQTWSDLELIVVDDGSTDDTQHVIERIEDQRLRYIHYPQRRGASAARNTGLKVAKGDFIAFQDSDDQWMPEKLELQLEAFKRLPEPYGVVYTGYRKIDSLGHSRSFPTLAASLSDQAPYSNLKLQGSIHPRLLRGNLIPTQTAMVRQDCFTLVGGFDDRLPRFQDWDIWLRLARRYQFKLLRRPLVNIYFTPHSISTDWAALTNAFEVLLEKHLTGEPQDCELKAQYHYAIGDLACQRGELQTGRQDFLEAIRLSPSNLVYRLAWTASFLGRDFYCKIVRDHGFSYGVWTE